MENGGIEPAGAAGRFDVPTLHSWAFGKVAVGMASIKGYSLLIFGLPFGYFSHSFFSDISRLPSRRALMFVLFEDRSWPPDGPLGSTKIHSSHILWSFLGYSKGT